MDGRKIKTSEEESNPDEDDKLKVQGVLELGKLLSENENMNEEGEELTIIEIDITLY